MCMLKCIKIFQKVYELSTFFFILRIWTYAIPRPMPNDIWQSLGCDDECIWQSICLDLVNSMCMQNFIKIYRKVQEMGPGSLSSEFEPRQNLDQSQMIFDNLLGYILSMSRCMQNFITVFHSIQEIGPFSLLQNLELSKASTDDKCHFASSWDISCQYQYVCKISSQFCSVQEIGPFSLFQNLTLGKAMTGDKCHFAISWARCCQYQCVCKSLSKYSKRFTSYRHSSRTVWVQNLYKQAGDKMFTNCPVTKSNVWLQGTTLKVNLQFRLTFLGSCNLHLRPYHQFFY